MFNNNIRTFVASFLIATFLLSPFASLASAQQRQPQQQPRFATGIALLIQGMNDAIAQANARKFLVEQANVPDSKVVLIPSIDKLETGQRLVIFTLPDWDSRGGYNNQGGLASAGKDAVRQGAGQGIRRAGQDAANAAGANIPGGGGSGVSTGIWVFTDAIARGVTGSYSDKSRPKMAVLYTLGLAGYGNQQVVTLEFEKKGDDRFRIRRVGDDQNRWAELRTEVYVPRSRNATYPMQQDIALAVWKLLVLDALDLLEGKNGPVGLDDSDAIARAVRGLQGSIAAQAAADDPRGTRYEDEPRNPRNPKHPQLRPRDEEKYRRTDDRSDNQDEYDRIAKLEREKAELEERLRALEENRTTRPTTPIPPVVRQQSGASYFQFRTNLKYVPGAEMTGEEVDYLIDFLANPHNQYYGPAGFKPTWCRRYGTGTKNAVMAFQVDFAANLPKGYTGPVPTATGELDAATRTALNYLSQQGLYKFKPYTGGKVCVQ